MKCERGNNPSTTDTCNPAKDSKINNCKAGKCVCGDGSTGTNGVCLAASTVPECRNSKGTLTTRGDQGASNTCKVPSSDTTKILCKNIIVEIKSQYTFLMLSIYIVYRYIMFDKECNRTE